MMTQGSWLGLVLVSGLTVAACDGPASTEPETSAASAGGAMDLVEITNGTVTVGALPALGGIRKPAFSAW